MMEERQENIIASLIKDRINQCLSHCIKQESCETCELDGHCQLQEEEEE